MVYYVAMITSANTETGRSPVAINHGLVAHLMVVTHFVMKDTLDRLTASNRYQKLSMTYERYIPVLVEGNISPGELAARVGSSKQACSKVIKELEKLEFIEGRQNPEDGRSRLLSLSQKGMQLLKDGNRATVEVHQELVDSIGSERMDLMIALLEKVCRGLEVELRSYPILQRATGETDNNRATRLNILLQALTGHMRDTLLADMSSKGFEGLRTNFGQILGMISREPRRIQYIASVIGISKQAAAAMAIEFESLGYVIRDPDPNDKRQIILRLSPQGERLVRESVASVRELESRVLTLLGEEDYRQLEAILADLYHTVAYQLSGTNGGINIVPEKIQQLTDYLLEELGVAGVRTLAQHLLTIA